MTTGCPEVDLFAATCRQAVKDARSGYVDAIAFLDECLPEWRRYVAAQQKRPRKGKTAQQGQNAHGQPVTLNGGRLVRSVSIANTTEE